MKRSVTQPLPSMWRHGNTYFQFSPLWCLVFEMRRLLLVGINDPQGSHAGVNVPSESDEMVALELAVNKSV